MHDPTKLLKLEDIVLSPGIKGQDNFSCDASTFFIAEAIQRLHVNPVKQIFSRCLDRFPTFPEIHQLPARKSQFWQFAGIAADEGTIEGTYKVHDNIFLDQLRLNRDTGPGQKNDFSERLFLVHGDQLTAARIRAVQHERRHARLDYDRRQWMLAVPSWFHIQYNLLCTIVRTHGSPINGETDLHCVYTDAMRWNRSQSSKDNVKFHLMEPIVAQGYTSRITALFYSAMRRRGLLNTEVDVNGRKEVLDHTIEQLSPDDFLSLVEDVRTTAFTATAWSSDTADVDFRTMCRLLQEVELFLTIRRAVKYADVGILRRVVDPLIVLFFGAGQTNYGREMLYYRWLLSPANDNILQSSILASGLMNWRGHAGAFKPIDLALEHLNCACKIDLRNNKNSTHDVEIVFKRTALCNTWIRSMRDYLESEYGERMPGTHTSSNAVDDMFLLAWQMYTGGFASERNVDSLPDRQMYDSVDIRTKGMLDLESRVDRFNSENVRRSAIGTAPVAEDTGNTDFIDIDALDLNEFATIVHDGYDSIDDPTVQILPVPAELLVEEMDLT